MDKETRILATLTPAPISLAERARQCGDLHKEDVRRSLLKLQDAGLAVRIGAHWFITDEGQMALQEPES